MASLIEKTFKDLKISGKSAFIPYITAGDPDINLSKKILNALPEGGADIIEIGMPFSDPMADGPAIQQSSLRALNNGKDMKKLLVKLKNNGLSDVTCNILSGTRHESLNEINRDKTTNQFIDWLQSRF